MFDNNLRGMIDDVKDGRLDRRAFVKRMIAVGLTAPMANQILSLGGVAMAQSPNPYKPTKRGGGGPLKLLWWQGPTLLNPHFATGTKDQDGSRIFYEPLASWDVDGHLNPILAAEIPSIQNGGLSADAKSVTWKLKPGVKWHDGKPLSADDVVFTWEYASDPATAAVSIETYSGLTVEKIDDLTIRINFKKPTPFWANAFVGGYGSIIPKHLFADYKGGKSREAPNNLKPVGTGPYKFVEFKPGDLIRGELNPDYHMANRPFFDTIEMKGRSLVIGATAKHAEVANSAIVGEAIPALAELAGMIGDPAVRHRGTIGGSLANNDPTADYPAAVLALGATIVTNKRRLKAEEYFQGLFSTALEADEIITKVMFPLPKKAAYIKFRNQASRYALVGVFVAKRPSDVRVAVTGAGSDGVFRATAFEEALKKRFSHKVLDGIAVPAEGLNSDLHGSAEYRAHLIGVLTRRAVEAANAKG